MSEQGHDSDSPSDSLWQPLPLTRIGVTDDGIAHYQIGSKARKGRVYEPCINLSDGSVDCSCEDFECRRRPAARDASGEEHYAPNIGEMQWHCKHINAALADCIRRGEIHFDLPDRSNMESQNSAATHQGRQEKDEQERLRLIGELSQKLTRDRVAKRPDGQEYLEAHDVISRLNDIFGHDGWTHEVKSIKPIDQANHIWLAETRLTVFFPGLSAVHREDVGIGNVTQRQGGEWIETPAEFDKAVKAAVSDSLKRCARTLGNQFGNSLYEKDRSERYDLVAPTRSAPQSAPHSNGAAHNAVASLATSPAPSPAPSPARATPQGPPQNGYAPPSPDRLYIESIPPGTDAAYCSQCNSVVYWVPTRSGKNRPINGNGTIHFDTCPAKTKDPALHRHNNTALGSDPNNPQQTTSPKPEPGKELRFLSQQQLDAIHNKAQIIYGDNAYDEVCSIVSEVFSGAKTRPEQLTPDEGRLIYNDLVNDLSARGSAAGEESALRDAAAAALRDEAQRA